MKGELGLDLTHRCRGMQVVLLILLDPYILLDLYVIQPLLPSMAFVFLHSKTTSLIAIFVAALKVCEGQLYTLYIERGTSFAKDDFWAFSGLLDCSHESIYMKWVCNLN